MGGALYVDRERRLACTPDLTVVDPERGNGIVQVKSAGSYAFRRDWQDDAGDPRCPRWIELQAVQEAVLVGAAWAAVLVITGENFEPHLFDIPLYANDFDDIEVKASAFWALVDTNTPPPLDYDRDGDLLKRLYPDAKEPLLDLGDDPDLLLAVEDYRDTAADIALLEKRRERARNAILERLGNHSGALVGSYRVSAKVVPRKEYTVAATTTRPIRIKKLTEEDTQ
jgi:hypothetical protein